MTVYISYTEVYGRIEPMKVAAYGLLHVACDRNISGRPDRDYMKKCIFFGIRYTYMENLYRYNSARIQCDVVINMKNEKQKLRMYTNSNHCHGDWNYGIDESRLRLMLDWYHVAMGQHLSTPR